MAVVGRVIATFSVLSIWLTLQVYTFNLEPRLPVIKQGEKGSYFGYSVAEHQVLSETNEVTEQVLLIGAPKAQTTQPGTNHSGAVYRCGLTTIRKDCRQIYIDQDEKPPDDSISKDDQWLGVTVRSQGPGKYVMTCAHRYVSKGIDYQWGQGICYSLTSYLDFHRAWEPCLNRPVAKAHEQFGYCQAGTSGEISEDNNIIIGSPGPYTWRGTVFTNSVPFRIRDDKTWYMGPLLDEKSPVDKYSYLGMSVTSGKFFGQETSFVGGAPRSNGTGQVVFFTKQKGKGSEFHVQLILDGEQFASSFGYTLTSLDINSDGYTDLVVGAPFYYGKEDGGAIYIYLNSEHGLNNTDSPIKITGEPESRFGFAVASAGDLNKDGYLDLAVGAPYEGRGAVYIYLGTSSGISKEPSQVIRVTDLPKAALAKTNIASFGYSLSGGMDLDSNGYPDLLVGAYASNSAVLLRSRPIIDIHTSVKGNLVNIDPAELGCREDPTAKLVCFSFQACFMFNSTVLSRGTSMKISYRIEAETFTGVKYYRATFNSSLHTSEPNIATKILTVSEDKLYSESCSEEIVYLKNKSDIQNPVKFKMTYSLIQKDPKMPYEGDPLPDINQFPILNQVEASKVFEAKFYKECGENEICECDLHLKAELNLPWKGNKQNFHLGEQFINMSVTVTNRNESAYDPMVYIMHSRSLTYGNSKVTMGDTVNCIPEETVLVCELSNPIKRETVEIQIWFNANSQELEQEEKITFIVIANTTSIEQTPEKDLKLEANVITFAELELRGRTEPEQVFYDGEVRGETGIQYLDDIGGEVAHSYVVTNHGPWIAKLVEVVIAWPYQLENQGESGKWILYLTEVPAVQGNGYCDLKPEHINPLKKKENPNVKNTIRKPDINFTIEETVTEESVRTRKKRSASKAEEHRSSGRTDKIVKLDCEKAKTAQCLLFSCFIKDLSSKKSTSIRINSRVWSSTFVADYPDVKHVEVISRARIQLDPVYKIQQQNYTNDVTMIKTLLIPDLPLFQKAEEVPLWIIILAACGGVLLLIIVILCLWKLGFFKRKKPGYMPAETSDKEKEANNI